MFLDTDKRIGTVSLLIRIGLNALSVAAQCHLSASGERCVEKKIRVMIHDPGPGRRGPGAGVRAQDPRPRAQGAQGPGPKARAPGPGGRAQDPRPRARVSGPGAWARAQGSRPGDPGRVPGPGLGVSGGSFRLK